MRVTVCLAATSDLILSGRDQARRSPSSVRSDVFVLPKLTKQISINHHLEPIATKKSCSLMWP